MGSDEFGTAMENAERTSRYQLVSDVVVYPLY